MLMNNWRGISIFPSIPFLMLSPSLLIIFLPCYPPPLSPSLLSLSLSLHPLTFKNFFFPYTFGFSPSASNIHKFADFFLILLTPSSFFHYSLIFFFCTLQPVPFILSNTHLNLSLNAIHKKLNVHVTLYPSV